MLIIFDNTLILPHIIDYCSTVCCLEYQSTQTRYFKTSTHREQNNKTNFRLSSKDAHHRYAGHTQMDEHKPYFFEK